MLPLCLPPLCPLLTSLHPSFSHQVSPPLRRLPRPHLGPHQALELLPSSGTCPSPWQHFCWWKLALLSASKCFTPSSSCQDIYPELRLFHVKVDGSLGSCYLAWDWLCLVTDLASDPRSPCPFHPRLIYSTPPSTASFPHFLSPSLFPFIPPSQPPGQLLTKLFILGLMLGPGVGRCCT